MVDMFLYCPFFICFRLRGNKYNFHKETEDLVMAVERNHAKEKITFRMRVCKMLSNKKFLHPFGFLLLLFISFGWSGFVYISLNGIDIFKVKFLLLLI